MIKGDRVYLFKEYFPKTLPSISFCSIIQSFKISEKMSSMEKAYDCDTTNIIHMNWLAMTISMLMALMYRVTALMTIQTFYRLEFRNVLIKLRRGRVPISSSSTVIRLKWFGFQHVESLIYLYSLHVVETTLFHLKLYKIKKSI